MVLHTPQPSWRYAIFQIPAILTVGFLILALLTNYLGWFSPTVSVQMMLDISSSTYANNVFRGFGTVMEAEIEAVKDYANQNANAPSPNLLSLSGFADEVIPITQNFSNKPVEIHQALDQVVQPAIVSQVGGNTNLDLAVEKGLDSLDSQSRRCKEMLVVTDGKASLEPAQLDRAKLNRVRLNFLIVGRSVPENLLTTAKATGGVALPANVSNIKDLVTGEFRERFNSNSRFVNFFLGLAVVSFMWMLVLPIDKFLQKHWNMYFDYSGRIAISNAFLWTIVILLIVGLPIFEGC